MWNYLSYSLTKGLTSYKNGNKINIIKLKKLIIFPVKVFRYFSLINFFLNNLFILSNIPIIIIFYKLKKASFKDRKKLLIFAFAFVISLQKNRLPYLWVVFQI